MRLPSCPLKTRYKIALARVAFRVLRSARNLTGRRLELQAVRGGIRWQLDLREGIDLSIYLLGAFEPRTVRALEKWIQPGDTALDIGANVGAHTLRMARVVGPSGRVIAFEPTAFAFSKLLANCALNPELAPRIVAEHAFLVDSPVRKMPAAVYSSWPLDAQPGLHPQHQGRLMALTDARSTTLDDYVAERGIGNVDLVKMDVDGNEPVVLRGAMATLARFKPVIVMELAPYLHEEAGFSFAETVASLSSNGYALFDEESGTALPADTEEIVNLIPKGASRNVVARHCR